MALGTALGLSLLLVPLAGRLARRHGVMDAPGLRKVHARPMPRLGGLAVFVSFAVVLVAVGFPSDVELVGALAGAAVAFGVGLADDVLGRRFPVGAKAAGLLAAALVVHASGVRLTLLPAGWGSSALTLLWLAGITNAFNLLDNMDGLCAGVALVASGLLIANGCALGDPRAGLVLVALMGSLLGFLVYNWNPASIFLGDCGSLFIGSLMGSLTILGARVPTSSRSFSALMPLLILAVPVLDTATVIVIRLRERRPIYIGDRRHLSHRLVSLGLSQRSAVAVLCLVSLCLGLETLSLPRATPTVGLLVLAQAVVFVSLLLVLLFVAGGRAKAGRSMAAEPRSRAASSLRLVS